MLRQTSRTFASPQPEKVGRGTTPARAIRQKRNAICSAPAARIAIATRWMRWSSRSSGKNAIQPSMPIQQMFSRHGVKLDALNRPSELSTPIPNAAAQMKIMYGRSVFTSRIVSLSRAMSSSPSSARYLTTTSSPPMHSRTIAPSISRTIVITARASFAAFSTDADSTSPLKTGTNAAVSAPSPKSLRAMLGIAKASVKALCATPAPMYFAWKISRTIPSTRLSAVKAPTVNVFLSMPPVPAIVRSPCLTRRGARPRRTRARARRRNARARGPRPARPSRTATPPRSSPPRGRVRRARRARGTRG